MEAIAVKLLLNFCSEALFESWGLLGGGHRGVDVGENNVEEGSGEIWLEIVEDSFGIWKIAITILVIFNYHYHFI